MNRVYRDIVGELSGLHEIKYFMFTFIMNIDAL